jgi:small subunit ribosomal protein S11
MSVEKTEKIVKTKKKKVARHVPKGIAHIQATFNNTIVTITDFEGNVICWSSAGRLGFKGARKSTAFVAQKVAEQCGKLAMDSGMREIKAYVNGPGAGRESAIRALQSVGLTITLIKDVTPVPHNGCRPPKKRRV